MTNSYFNLDRFGITLHGVFGKGGATFVRYNACYFKLRLSRIFLKPRSLVGKDKLERKKK